MSKFTPGKWRVLYSPLVIGIVDEDNDPIQLNEANARLIAAAPEMYRLLCEFLKVDAMKVRASTEKNDPAYMMALVAQDRAVKMSKELLARIDGKEASNE